MRPHDHDFFGWVERLAIPHHERDAMWHLILSGPPALDAVRAGLAHDDPAVRVGCTKVMDHLVDDASLADLLEMIVDDDAKVRLWAMHSLACERCKENGCSPDKATVLPAAIARLRDDPVGKVRTTAIGVVARWVHTDPVALDAIADAAANDPDRVVRKSASWWIPGGPRYERTKPKVRKRRAAPV